MKVKSLIKKLKKMNPNAEIINVLPGSSEGPCAISKKLKLKNIIDDYYSVDFDWDSYEYKEVHELKEIK